MKRFSEYLSRSGRFGLITLLAATLTGCGGFLIQPVPTEQALQQSLVGGQSGWFVSDAILIVDIDGEISNRRDTGLFGGDNPVSLFVEKLDRAEADGDIAGIILRINSPGGSVAATEIMRRRLDRFRAARPEVPVVAAIQDVGASGAYYLACGADEIIVLPSSITGSIGVVMQTFSVADAMRMFGVSSRAIVSGPFKDLASPFKPLDEKDSKLLQGIVDEFYQRFIAVVAAGRKDLTTEQVRALADGRVYTGVQAVANGLADRLGDMHDAEMRVRQRAGIAKARLVMYHRPMGWRGSVESAAAVDGAKMALSPRTVSDLARPRFMYLWQ